ncbi:MAG: DASS family sodium-coupled anion symporter [Phycisphaeraceae bacterium]|nr:DASS family sodium-coupled anion symporter [Phycisphaerales bacterium]QOJ17339.1 MAG: DASS family sodium-coupled anion symporter [Phycisphaeraceae bacterium]
MASESDGSTRRAVQWAGLALGPALALLAYWLLPATYANAAGEVVPFTPAGRATLAMMIWMGTWWLTEAIDITATALLPLAVFPLLGIAGIRQAAAPYADETIFLFMGGFILALSMQRWGLDKRIALLTLRVVGTHPINMVGGFMLATAMISAFVSNTATAAMMMPIALSVINLVRSRLGKPTVDASNPGATPLGHFGLCLMLGIAYAASIGGLATIIGSPPNVIAVGFLRDRIAPQHRLDMSFAQWLELGLPLTLIFLPLTWLLLTRVLYPIRMGRIEGGGDMIRSEFRALGRAGRGEWITFIVFIVTVMLWITRPLLTAGIGGSTDAATGEASWVIPPIPGLTDAVIAMLAALVLFILPVNARKRQFTMDWPTASGLPWGILLLFGGGLSLAGAVQSNGVAEFLGSHAGGLSALPDFLIVLMVVLAIIFLTELTSNTATTAALIPVLAGLAPGLGVSPYLLVIPATFAASCAFMLPVATPPNAIVFGTGFVTIPQMCKAGLWLNLVGSVLITIAAFIILPHALGDRL